MHVLVAGKPYLHADKLGDLPILGLDGRDCEQVPEGRAILPVVQQPHTADLSVLHCIPDLANLLGVRPFPL